MQWNFLAIGVIVFAVIIGFQAWFLSRSVERIIKDDSWARTVEDWSKLIRQDVAGVLLLLSITNGLLGAIAAILLFHR
jgi:hypothetical protein